MEDYSHIWAVIENGIVVNTFHYDGNDPDFIETFKKNSGADAVISGEGSEYQPGIGWSYDFEKKEFVIPGYIASLD